ncbi:hypothetical protein VINI7043_28745 [Vibrio nigripulchritudo ATCC 27043]|jgi:hypothetical protein|nr:hypothetical protein VINI7043_28745 [Vibrio nigripulchritudo ATCC 27043]
MPQFDLGTFWIPAILQVVFPAEAFSSVLFRVDDG